MSMISISRDGVEMQVPAEEFGPLPSSARSIEDYRRAIQVHIDVTAQSRGYDSGVSCASYLGSTNPAWAAEAATLIAWRDAVWTYAQGELAKVEAGERDRPTVKALVEELPAVDWPEP